MESQPVWLITGCSSGLGLAIARYAISQGHRVIATSRTPSKTPELVAEIEKSGSKWLTLDVAAEDLEENVKKAEAAFGQIDILVNNAGYSIFGANEDISAGQVRNQMEANFVGPFRTIKTLLPKMRERKSGLIINLTSPQAISASPSTGMYGASKAALEALTDSLRSELAPFGIRTLLVSPGAFLTSFVNNGLKGITEPSAPYADPDHPVYQRLKLMETYVDKSPGDPAKAARIIFDVATGREEAGTLVWANGLSRLYLGTGSWDWTYGKVNDLLRELELEKDIAGMTDRDDL